MNTRVHSIAELAQFAQDPTSANQKTVKDWLRIADALRRQGNAAQAKDNTEAAFLYFARSGAIVLEKIPNHKGYHELNAAQKTNLNANGRNIIDSMEQLKPRISDSYEQWAAKHPELVNSPARLQELYGSTITPVLKRRAAKPQDSIHDHYANTRSAGAVPVSDPSTGHVAHLQRFVSIPPGYLAAMAERGDLAQRIQQLNLGPRSSSMASQQAAPWGGPSQHADLIRRVAGPVAWERWQQDVAEEVKRKEQERVIYEQQKNENRQESAIAATEQAATMPIMYPNVPRSSSAQSRQAQGQPGHTLACPYLSQPRSLSDSAPWTSPPLGSPTTQPLQGNFALPNQAPPTHRVWLCASEVRRRLLSIISEESLDSVRRTKAISVVEEVLGQQQQSPPQPPDPRGLPATSRSPLSARLHHTQHKSPAGHVLSSPIALQRVSPDYGPISGSEKIFLVGYGFSEGQDLLVRFGDNIEPVSTKLLNSNILECILPPSHSARRVAVTLHWEDGPEIQNEGDVLFTYEDVDNELTSSFRRVLNLWQQKSSRLKYNPSVYSFTASSMCGPPVSIESRNILTTEITDTIQDSDLSSDSDPGDDLGAQSPIPWSPEERDSINLVNNRGQNLAHICAQLGHPSLLINVIEKGAHIHAEDMNGRTPLDFARLYRDEDAIDILEGDWDDNIQNVISTGLLTVDLLHRYTPECVLAIQAIKISVGIGKGSGDFAQAQPMSASIQGGLRPDRFVGCGCRHSAPADGHVWSSARWPSAFPIPLADTTIVYCLM